MRILAFPVAFSLTIRRDLEHDLMADSASDSFPVSLPEEVRELVGVESREYDVSEAPLLLESRIVSQFSQSVGSFTLEKIFLRSSLSTRKLKNLKTIKN